MKRSQCLPNIASSISTGIGINLSKRSKSNAGREVELSEQIIKQIKH